jgi:hypothetical protein
MWTWSFPSPTEAREEVFWSLAVLVIVPHEAPPHEGLLSIASVIVSPLGRSWAIEGAQEQVDQDTPVSRTPTVAPESLARECALLRVQRARGPQKLLGPPTACVNARSEDHVKMQRLRTRGMTAAVEMKWWVTL